MDSLFIVLNQFVHMPGRALILLMELGSPGLSIRGVFVSSFCPHFPAVVVRLPGCPACWLVYVPPRGQLLEAHFQQNSWSKKKKKKNIEGEISLSLFVEGCTNWKA